MPLPANKPHTPLPGFDHHLIKHTPLSGPTHPPSHNPLLAGTPLSPAEAEAEAAQVGHQPVQSMVGATPGLEIDVELGELQLHIADVMQEEHEEAHVVVSAE